MNIEHIESAIFNLTMACEDLDMLVEDNEGFDQQMDNEVASAVALIKQAVAKLQTQERSMKVFNPMNMLNDVMKAWVGR